MENLVNYNWYIMPNAEKEIVLTAISNPANQGSVIPFPGTYGDGLQVFNSYQPSERNIIGCSEFSNLDNETSINDSGIYLTPINAIINETLDFTQPEIVKKNRNYTILKGTFENIDDQTIPANQRLYLSKEQGYYQAPIFEAITSEYEEIGDYFVFDFNDVFPLPIRFTPYKTFINGELVQSTINSTSITNTKIKILKNNVFLRNKDNYCKIIFTTLTSINYFGELQLESGDNLNLESGTNDFLLLEGNGFLNVKLHYNNYEKEIQKSTIVDGSLFEFFLNNNLILELFEGFKLSTSIDNNTSPTSQVRQKIYDPSKIIKTITFEQIIDNDRVNIKDYANETFSIVGWNASERKMLIFSQCKVNSGMSFSYNRTSNTQSVSAKYLDRIYIEHDSNYDIIKEVRN